MLSQEIENSLNEDHSCNTGKSWQAKLRNMPLEFAVYEKAGFPSTCKHLQDRSDHSLILS